LGSETRISESEVGALAEFRVSHLEIRLPTSMERYFYWETCKYDFPSPMERRISVTPHRPLTLATSYKYL